MQWGSSWGAVEESLSDVTPERVIAEVCQAVGSVL